MKLEVQRDSGIPLYIQVKDMIKELIRQKVWVPGSKLPTERSLAEELKISRNTVSMAFRELEAEGIIVCQQGRGTFVAESDEAVRRESRRERLLRIIDIAMEEATALGFSIDQFLAITHVRAREKQDILSRANIVLIECNREQVEYFARELAHSVGVIIQPILLGELENDPDKYQNIIRQADIVITTLFHLQSVKEIVGPLGTEIIALALSPLLDSIVRIARLPDGAQVGIFCISSSFAEKMLSALRNAGINHLRFATFLGPAARETVLSQINSVDYIIASPGRKQELVNLTDKDVIEFIFSPDQASIDLLRSTLMELEQKNLKRWEKENGEEVSG
ncbi:MAG TPA: GntR family transcriptional regulator [Bacillota bacterium]|nr:GntR family transcriptional regulator [Bacillota bacterium]HPZ90068.1 GntR family transcriptional regulator [Bacillota bacterium]